MKEYFKVSAKKYDETKDYCVVRPSSLNNPKDNSVMFITPQYMSDWKATMKVKECIVIWPDLIEVPEELLLRHVVICHPDPRLGYAEFFHENNITYNCKPKTYQCINGAFICTGASIGENTTIFPGAYIDSEVVIGNNCYIGSGVRLLGAITIGNDCIIRENTVIGSDGLTTKRSSDGKVITIPQFGGVTIEDNVQIGALCVVAKGAIDNTLIKSGCRIDNSCFISHNVRLGEDTLMVGESFMFGSTSTGKQAYISGNVCIRDGIAVGEKATVGMGAVVVKPVPDGATVKGNPAK